MLTFNRGTRLHPRPFRLHLRNQTAGNVSVRITGNALFLVSTARQAMRRPNGEQCLVGGWCPSRRCFAPFRGRGPRLFSHARRSDVLQPLRNMPLCGPSRRRAFESARGHSCSTISFGSSPTISTSRRSTVSIGERMSKIIRSTHVSRGP